MKHDKFARATARSVLYVSAVVGVLGTTATAIADGLATPDALNMQLLGHHDMQNRPIYQPTVHKYPTNTGNSFAGHMLLFAGLHAATGGGGCPAQQLPNPLNGGACERDGVLVVDVTNPSNPVLVKHIQPLNPANVQAQMVRVCDGSAQLGTVGHVYLLASDGAGGGNGQHDVYDVTDPSNPVVLSTPVSGLSSTHKSWWECETGIAWIVAGDAARTGHPGDGWNTNQHMKLFDLSNPANPVYIRDIGLVGQNPGSSVTSASSSGVHGPIIAITNPHNGETINRRYIP